MSRKCGEKQKKSNDRATPRSNTKHAKADSEANEKKKKHSNKEEDTGTEIPKESALTLKPNALPETEISPDIAKNPGS